MLVLSQQERSVCEKVQKMSGSGDKTRRTGGVRVVVFFFKCVVIFLLKKLYFVLKKATSSLNQKNQNKTKTSEKNGTNKNSNRINEEKRCVNRSMFFDC